MLWVWFVGGCVGGGGSLLNGLLAIGNRNYSTLAFPVVWVGYWFVVFFGWFGCLLMCLLCLWFLAVFGLGCGYTSYFVF